ncbi:GNAT family N-acetyltransferase [Patescibacteria group bacterium]|nr:GNAT family N-acetyltransferase [Patescibacteria group bacterium]
MELIQGHKTTPEEFIWWFENNPTRDLNIYLAINNAQIIGISCHSAFKMLHNGQEHIVSFPLNVLTHPQYREQGIFSRLQLANEEHANKIGCPFMLGFPNAVTTPIFLNEFGWNKIRTPILYLRPLKFETIVSKINFISWTSSFVKLLNPFFEKEVRIAKYGLSTKEVPEFGQWVDDIFEANIPLLRSCIVRRKEYLNWRFFQDPQKEYRVFAVRKGSEIIGYYVLGKIYKRGFLLGYVANALLLPEYHHHFFDIQNSFIPHFRRMNVAFVLGWDAHFFKSSRPFYFSGYFPMTRRFHFICKASSPDYSEEELQDEGRWFFQLGDLDFF